MSFNNQRTLILNASYEPISVISYKRAVTLLISHKINTLKNSNLIINSERKSIFIPKVAILNYYAKVPYVRKVALNRENIFIRDLNTCQYCGKNAESIDHIKPKSKGGKNEWSNVVACCKKCNLIKADKDLIDTSLTLKSNPVFPGGNFWIKTIVGKNPDPSWGEYLISA